MFYDFRYLRFELIENEEVWIYIYVIIIAKISAENYPAMEEIGRNPR